MFCIEAEVNGHQLRIGKPTLLSAGGQEIDKVAFTFSADWEGFSKSAIFEREDQANTTDATQKEKESENAYEVLLDEENSATIPWEVLRSAGGFRMWVKGSLGNARHSTQALYCRISEGPPDNTVNGLAATPDLAADILDRLTTKIDIRQGSEKAGKALVIDSTGKVVAGEAVLLDDTLSQSGQAAEAKSVGEKLSELEGKLGAPSDEQVDNWLTSHPEATTTVLDNSITPEKTSFISYSRADDEEEIVPNFTNQLALASAYDSDEPLNGLGYYDGKRLSSSFGSSETAYLSTGSGFFTSGYIPWVLPKTGLPPTIYLRGAKINSSQSSCRMYFFKSDKTSSKVYIEADSTTASNVLFHFGDIFDIEELTGSQGEESFSYQRLVPKASGDTSVLYDSCRSAVTGGEPYRDGIVYFRISLSGSGSDVILTTGEPISYTSQAIAGEHTGYFLDESITVPTAAANATKLTVQSERILDLERELESLGGDIIPEYIRSEADSLCQRFLKRQSGNTFSILVLSDMHIGYYKDPDNQSVQDAAKAAKLIAEKCSPDLIGILGDFSVGASDTTSDDVYRQISICNRLFYPFTSRHKTIFLSGNHDDAPYQGNRHLSKEALYGLIGRQNLRWDPITDSQSPHGGYGYIDFPSRQLRILYLNTDERQDWEASENDNGNYLNAHNLSAQQLQWLADSGLNFQDKEDPTKWSILLLSHVSLRVSGNYTDNDTQKSYDYSTSLAARIMQAYRDQTAGSFSHNGQTVSYDFSSGPKATLIGSIHGHSHNYSQETVGTDILSIGVPNCGFGRERQSSDQNTYSKTQGTAESTSFCLLTLDLSSKKILLDHYGAGYDLEANW